MCHQSASGRRRNTGRQPPVAVYGPDVSPFETQLTGGRQQTAGQPTTAPPEALSQPRGGSLVVWFDPSLLCRDPPVLSISC